MTVSTITQIYGFKMDREEVLKAIAALIERLKASGDLNEDFETLDGDGEIDYDAVGQFLYYADWDENKDTLFTMPEGCSIFVDGNSHGKDFFIGHTVFELKLEPHDNKFAKQRSDPLNLSIYNEALLKFKEDNKKLIKKSVPSVFFVTDDCHCCS